MTGWDAVSGRDAVIEAMLPHVPARGWTRAAVRAGLTDLGAAPEDAEMLFGGGAGELIEAFIDLADRRMIAAAAEADMAELRLPARVRAVIALRLDWLRPHRQAVRRAVGVLALPGHLKLAACCTARTVDAIWFAAGDRSADFSWYTKRAILAGVYGSTLLAWLNDDSEDDSATLAFLDRRLAGVAGIGKLRRRVRERFSPTGAAA